VRVIIACAHVQYMQHSGCVVGNSYLILRCPACLVFSGAHNGHGTITVIVPLAASLASGRKPVQTTCLSDLDPVANTAQFLEELFPAIG